MLAKLGHPRIILLAANGSGGPLLLHALGAHSRLHAFHDGGLILTALRLLDLAGAEGKRRPGRIEQLLAGPFELDSPAEADALRTAASPIAEGERRELLGALAGALGELEPAAVHRLARERLAAIARQLGERAAKPETVMYATDCASRVELVASLFPDARIVHLLRDGRAVALAQQRASQSLGGLARWADAWLGEIVAMARFEAANPDRVTRTYYDDLLVSPRPQLERLCQALKLAPEGEAMASALVAACSPADRLAFNVRELDDWQTIELESRLQPALSLLGFRPGGELGAVGRLRVQAAACEAARSEAEELREKLRSQAMLSVGPSRAPDGDEDTLSLKQRYAAMAEELAALRLQVRQDEDAVEELRQLRFQLRDQQNLPPDIKTLRWKAKRYDHLRAAASPILRLRRLRSRS